MVMLVTLQEASDHLRRDTTDDDNDLELKIEAASVAVLNYISDHSFLNTDGSVDVDTAGNILGVPKPIQQAVLIIVGMFYVDRDAPDFRSSDNRSMPRVGEITLPKAVLFLLDPYRTPTCL